MLGIVSNVTERYIPTLQTNLVPIMSSASKSPYTIICSSIYTGAGERSGWTAFDGKWNTDYGWHVASGFSYPLYCGFTNSARQSKVTHINMYCRPNFNNRMPGNWSLLGSNDGSTWYDILNYTNGSTSSISVNVNRYLEWYYDYRIFIRAGAGGDSININEIQFLGYWR